MSAERVRELDLRLERRLARLEMILGVTDADAAEHRPTTDDVGMGRLLRLTHAAAAVVELYAAAPSISISWEEPLAELRAAYLAVRDA